MAINYFQLPDGVRVAKNLPIDGDRYIADDMSKRDQLVLDHRVFVGLQVYVTGGTAEEIGLYVCTDSVDGNTVLTLWDKVGSSIDEINDIGDVNITNIQSGDTLVWENGEWINTGDTSLTLLGGTGITLDNGVPGFITIENSKYVSGFTIDTLSNELDIELVDGTHFPVDLGYLVDTDSYVCGGTYDPRSGGTIDFTTNTGMEFAVSGISNASLDSLTDTTLTNPQDNDILVYTGGTWVNSANTGADDWLDNDLLTTITVGGVVEGTNINSGTTFEELFIEILSPEIAPELNPSNSILLAGYTPLEVEIGTALSFTLSHTYNQGIIESKDTHTDVPYTGPESGYTYYGDGTVDASTGVVTHTATTTQSWTVDLDYYATGGSYYSSRGIEKHNFDSIHLYSGTTSNTGTIIGYYNYWYASDTSSLSNGSSIVRTYSYDKNTTSFSYDIAPGNSYTAFYIVGAERKISVKHVQSSNAQYCVGFVATSVNIPDANGVDVAYTKYEQTIGGTGYSVLATYDVIIGGLGSGCI